MEENQESAQGPKPKTRGYIGKTIRMALGTGVLRHSFGVFRSLLWNKSAQWGYETTRDSIQEIRSANKTPREGAPESFAEVCDRLNLSEDDLIERYDDLALQGVVFRCLGYGALISGLVSGWMAESFFWFVLIVINALCAAAMFFGLAFVRYFRAWQVTKRELLPIKDFIGEGGIYRAFL